MKNFAKNIILFLVLIVFLYVPNAYAVRPSKGIGEKDKIIDQCFMEGINFYLQRDFKKASELWKKVLEMQPTHNRAKIYFEKAFQKYQDMEINFYHGLYCFTKEDYHKAIEYFKKTLLINPGHKKAIYYLELYYKLLQVNLKIVQKPEKDAPEVKNLNITTDDEVVLYAIGYGGLNQYLGLIKVNWENTGTLDAVSQKEKTAKIKFAPDTFDTSGSIIAFLNKEIKTQTGKIKVKKGKLKYVKIMDAPNFMGENVQAIETIDISAGMIKKLYAAGFDKNDIYIGDVPVDWNTVGDIDKMKIKNSSEFSFQLKQAGKGKIIARAKNKFVVIISNVTIRPCELSYIQIEDAKAGKGKEIYNIQLTTDDTKIFYSVGYDAFDNLISNIECKWYTTGTLEQFNTYNMNTFSFSPKTADVYGTIKAEKPDIIGDETGMIKILPGKAEKIYIIKLPGKNAAALKKLTIKAGEKEKIFSAGFNEDNRFLKLYNVKWKIQSEKALREVKNRNNVKLHYTKAPQDIIIDLYHPKVKCGTSFIVSVIPNKIKKFIISEYANKPSTNFFTVSADNKKEFFGLVFDKYNNFIEQVKCKWKLDNLTGHLSDRIGSATVFYPDKVGKGRLQAAYSRITKNKADKYTSDIVLKVIPGKMDTIGLMSISDNILITNIILGYNKRVKLRAVALDKMNNYIKDIEANWQIPGKMEILKDDYGIMNVLTGTEDEFEGKVILTKDSLDSFQGTIKILPRELITTVSKKEFGSKNIILYYVYNGDTFSEIMVKTLKLTYKWKKICKYIKAICEYNKIENIDLIFPKQVIDIPYYQVNKKITIKELAKELFNDEAKEENIIIYKKKGKIIIPEDKVLIIDEEFLRTGHLESGYN